MTKTYQPLFSDPFLRSALAGEYRRFQESGDDAALIERLQHWQDRRFQTETQAEGAFTDLFFKQTWDYHANGERAANEGFTCYPRFRIAGAGQTGGRGEADLALGWFGRADIPETPQVMSEFKDIRSNLDAPQNRKGNTRSPVKQCADYLREAAKPLFGNEAIQPTWGIVTDMNEFRLYRRDTMPADYQRFVINPATTDDAVSLLAQGEEASFQRFLFATLFHADQLLSTGGLCPLLQLLKRQRILEKEIENDFYREYKEYRERLYRTLVTFNQEFSGTRGKLVRHAQKLIDRCIFVMFCEDMGEVLSFPPNALREYLAEISRAPFYEPAGQDVWNKLKELFRAMDRGEHIFGRRLNRFNGGLFAEDSELDSLFIPNQIFCERMQGENPEAIQAHKNTLLYLSAQYNFGTSNSGGQAITLYTLGRIFEQSITELEVLEAEAEERPSLTKETKRKRDGVYYTPEWVVRHIVEETLGPRLQEIRDELGWSITIEGDNDLVRQQKERAPSRRSQEFVRHVDAVRMYRDRLNSFTVLDPACGSGAFLIHTLEYLLRERQKVMAELHRVTPAGEGLFEFNADAEIRTILSRNIYGVDINPSSVEITRLALWLHTAKPDQALCDLDGNIQDGNSLIGPEFYETNALFQEWNAERRETVNAFDWEARFPQIFREDNPDGPGFDCIVGNPPYVKLQNFKKVYSEMADYLRDGAKPDGAPVYESTQRGNFDLFLPFIEKSIQLLSRRGSMGFIAPSLWRFNVYGEPLRAFLHRGQHLDRWIDFGSHQIFEEAITYTALQFYSKAPCQHVRFVLAPDGKIADAPDWDDPDWRMTYRQLPQADPWVFVPRHEREFIARLQRTCRRLDDPAMTGGIFVGVQTSANEIYHLRKIGENRYLHKPKEGEPYEVTIEDEIMKPLVSGPEAKRYTAPITDTYILFPYDTNGEAPRLYLQHYMMQNFPRAWDFLQSYEGYLRAREDSAFNDDEWFRFGRHQNIDKQNQLKLIVAQTVPEMRVCPDSEGAFCLDNVRVNGILPTQEVDFWFLLGVLNSKPVDWVFRRIAKPKDGGFFEANKQFIAPLPIPNATTAQKESVGAGAQTLQQLYTQRRDRLAALERRLESCPVRNRNGDWLWPDVGTAAHWKERAPGTLSAREKTAWAKEKRQEVIDSKLQDIDARLLPSASMSAAQHDAELSFSVGGVPVIDRVFVNATEGGQILQYWKHLARTLTVTEKFNAGKLTGLLCKTPMTDNAALAAQIAATGAEIETLETRIAAEEAAINALIFDLYGLSEEERRMVMGQRRD